MSAMEQSIGIHRLGPTHQQTKCNDAITYKQDNLADRMCSVTKFGINYGWSTVEAAYQILIKLIKSKGM